MAACTKSRRFYYVLPWQRNDRVLTAYEIKRRLAFIIYLFLVSRILYNNKINARVLIGQSPMVYCAGKPMKKSHVFWIII